MELIRLPLLVLAACSALSASAQELVRDGGFESAGNGSFPIDGSSIDGYWIVGVAGGSGGVLVIHDNPQVISGLKSVQTNFGSSLSQTLSTTAGLAYRIEFDTKGIPGPYPFAVSFGAQSFDLTSAGNAGARHFAFEAGATSGATTLRLGSGSVLFDNVKLQVVPEPSALAALGLGGLAMLKRRKRA